MGSTDFDRLAARYDAWYQTPLGAWADRHETESVFGLLALEPGERLVDLGTGTGRHIALAARAGARVTGVDPSEGMLAVASARLRTLDVDLVRANARSLPFADRTFDAALAVTSLCFVPDAGAVLSEAARVLRPGGRLVLGELNRWSLWALVRRAEGFVRPTTYRAAHFRGIRELRRLLAAAGLESVRWEGRLLLPPVNRAGMLSALEPLERIGQRRAAALGAFLAVEARKPPHGQGKGSR